MEEPQEQLSLLIFRNTFWNFIFNLVNRFGGLLFTVLLARALQPELFGAYSLVLGVVLLVASAFEQGINTTATKYISEAFGSRNKGQARASFRFLFQIKVAVSLIASLALVFLAPFIAASIFHTPSLTVPLQVGASYLFFTSLLTSFIAFFYAARNVKPVAQQEFIFQVSRFALVFFLLSISVEHVFVALSGGVILSLAFLVFLSFRKYPFMFSGTRERINRKKILSFFFFIALASVTSSFFIHVDVVMIGALLPGAELAGFYQVASTIVISIAAIITFTNVSLPVFTQLYGTKLKKSFQQFFRYSCMFSLPISFGLIFVAEPFIAFFFGPEYSQALPPLMFLSFLIFESATGIFFTMLLAAKDRTKEIAYLMIAANVINIVLCYFMITKLGGQHPFYGIVGAAIATLLSRYLYLASIVFIVKKEFNLLPAAASFFRPFGASIFMSFILFFLPFRHASLPGAFFAVFIGTCAYFICLWLIHGISREDIVFAKRILPFSPKDSQ